MENEDFTTQLDTFEWAKNMAKNSIEISKTCKQTEKAANHMCSFVVDSKELC